jgi:hypothetical protein
MAKAHPERQAGDVCLGVVKDGGNEFLAYSSDDSGGVCHVGGLKAEKVGYVSMREVNAFIAKYGPKAKPLPPAREIINLVAQNLASTEIVFRETLLPRAEFSEMRRESFQLFSKTLRSDFLAVEGLCEYLKDLKGLNKQEQKAFEKACSGKTPASATR